MEIIHLNNANIESWIQQIQAYLRTVDNSEIEMLYQNLDYTVQRISAGIEQSFLAEESEKIIGMIAAFGNIKKTAWNLMILHVATENRLHLVGTKLFNALEQALTVSGHEFKIIAQCKVLDKYTNIFYLSKDFQFEGWYRAMDEADDMYVWAKIYADMQK